MIITKTPLRVSFLGGGTDYPDYFRQHGGQTLGVAIDKYSYVIVNRLAQLFEHTIRVSYSRTELVSGVDQIEHPAVRGCLQFLGLDGHLEVHYVGDLPARTGLGSSSSFTVGLLHALHALKGELVSAEQLAAEAVYVEQQVIGERVGVQDQYTCAYGGLVHLQFERDGHVRVSPVPLPPQRLSELQSHMMLFYTGISRHAHEVLEEQLERTKQGINATDLSYLSSLVTQGLDVLINGHPISLFGELLHCAWMAKRRLSSKISTAAIDQGYDCARQAGAIGGKLLGAGGGGFLLLIVEPAKQQAVEQALRPWRRVEVAFDHTGSTLLFYQPTNVSRHRAARESS
ncbi:MAG: kinase [Acidobacteriota bacterium]|nr:kinase [Blastocatellia bacterium]MDW8241000.1 kinase [Acidobacteriota bacterium]